ncbi:MAG: DUF2325 domain-containing protein [Desulfarculaceae bacterium]|nr:DUF2325 domain-containing protein [Desulfarculaceae bacterium]MCF8071125.1 DUF2325 domain-containing protein [Desulfarculaceae bacterium]MCF8101272.1 DUF2325 domain-containing protein [Desulfarculaceae bacterium]MCF8115179.1 DUF2325 domain-containing protein [Desulfarculaceae bacterium]
MSRSAHRKQPGHLMSLEAMENPCPRCGRSCPCQCPVRESCPLQGRQVAVIGGLDRLEKNYTEVIEQMGGSCMCHTGKVRSGARRLRQMVSKSDLVVFLTPINSHAALNVVKKQCKLCSTPFCPLNCTSPAALESHLKKLSQAPRRAARPSAGSGGRC